MKKRRIIALGCICLAFMLVAAIVIPKAVNTARGRELRSSYDAY